MANSAGNNDIHKPWLIVVTRKAEAELTRAAFLASQAGVIGGFDSQEAADAALQSWFDDPEVPKDDLLRAAVVYDPVVSDGN